MSGLSFKFSIKNLPEVKAEINQIIYRMDNFQPALKDIGLYLLGSINRNFQEGGRPEKWKSSKRAEMEHGQTLLDTGRLRNSITAEVIDNILYVGTNVKYAAIHHFGGEIKHPARLRTLNFKISKTGISRFSKLKKANFQQTVQGRAYTILMPARPYLMIQNEDWPIIQNIAAKHILPQGTT